MLARIVTRTGIFAATVFVGSLVIFVLLAVLPGDPAQVALGTHATPQAIAQMRAHMGVDRPLIAQYGNWMGGLLSGNLGTSSLTGADIGQQIAGRLTVTLTLIALSLVATLAIALPIGSFAALDHRGRIGAVVGALSQVGVAVPSFIAAIVLINIFAVQLRLVPSGGWTSPTTDFGGFITEAILPVISIGLVQGALLSRYVRSAALDVLREDYMRTAWAKGFGRTRAFLRHGARNSAIPVVTVLGLQIASLLIDTIIVERVFVIPGLGSLLFDSVSNRDLTMVRDIVLLLVVAILALNLIIDAIYIAIDPRLKGAS
ncbi:MAG: ABC transporter permease [Gordonia sp. (in: high G+C Gram-positive bacteria)]